MIESNQMILKVYDTGDKPVLVEGNNLKDYVCKHNMGENECKKLFAEWMVHALLQELGVCMATREILWVKPEHVRVSAICQPQYFKVPLFATEYLEKAIEWTQLNTFEAKSIIDKEKILIIAFCDLWLANEDRNWGNFNLMNNPVQQGYELIPFDHAACFNTLSFQEDRPLVQLVENETLIDTDEFRKLVKPVVKNLKELSEFAETLYLRVQNLETIYDEQVVAIPKEWNISAAYCSALKTNLFHEDWLSETKYNFLSFIKASLNLK